MNTLIEIKAISPGDVKDQLLLPVASFWRISMARRSEFVRLAGRSDWGSNSQDERMVTDRTTV